MHTAKPLRAQYCMIIKNRIYRLALTVFLSWYTNLEFLAVLPDNDSIANRVLVNIPRVEGF